MSAPFFPLLGSFFCQIVKEQQALSSRRRNCYRRKGHKPVIFFKHGYKSAKIYYTSRIQVDFKKISNQRFRAARETISLIFQYFSYWQSLSDMLTSIRDNPFFLVLAKKLLIIIGHHNTISPTG